MMRFWTTACIRHLLCIVSLEIFGLAACAAEAASDYKWDLAAGFPPPPVPDDNPMTTAKVDLGRHIFYDKRLSHTGTQSCASCHVQALGFTDGKPVAQGATGEMHPRGSMSLVNVAWSGRLTWNNPRAMTLEEQMLVPMFGTHPVELGVAAGGAEFLAQARADERYQALFRNAYPSDPAPFTLTNVVRAIASFERTIHSARSDWDLDWQQLQLGAAAELSEPRTTSASREGELLFFGDKLACGRCHGGPNFDSTFSGDGAKAAEPVFHNNGMPANVLGVGEYTKQPSDMGKFKAPTMRNIEITAPYMHDGRFSTLDEVVDHYASGGSHTQNQSPLVQGFTLTEQEKSALLAFLRSLTDLAVTRDPRFSDPWIYAVSRRPPSR